MSPPGRRRGAEAGLVRGCCLSLVLLVLVLVALGFVGVRAAAAPDLGPPPGGVAHGSSEAIIAAALAGDAASQLIRGEHAVVVLSERDLTVIAQARNPSPARYRDPQARIRGGHVLVSADMDAGPLGVTAVATFELLFSDTPSATTITVRPLGYTVGQLDVPAFIGDRLEPRGATTVDITALFASNPVLEALARSLDCVAVRPDGVHVGFHRPLTTPGSVSCG